MNEWRPSVFEQTPPLGTVISVPAPVVQSPLVYAWNVVAVANDTPSVMMAKGLIVRAVSVRNRQMKVDAECQSCSDRGKLTTECRRRNIYPGPMIVTLRKTHEMDIFWRHGPQLDEDQQYYDATCPLVRQALLLAAMSKVTIVRHRMAP